jgi:hypothetical protein
MFLTCLEDNMKLIVAFHVETCRYTLQLTITSYPDRPFFFLKLYPNLKTS